jgi:hypothetical protein
MTTPQSRIRITDAFFEHAETAQIVILSPESKAARPLIHEIMSRDGVFAMLYELNDQDDSLTNFMVNLTQSFTEQCDIFNQYTSAAEAVAYKGLNEYRGAMIEGISKDMARLQAAGSHDRLILIFDSFDLSAGESEISRFVVDLALRLPEGSLIVINGREVERVQWLMPVLATAKTILLKDGEISQQQFMDKDVESTGYGLEILALGPGKVFFNNVAIDHWEGHLPRLLLFFAIDRGTITRDDFHRAFWGDLSGDQATNVFHVTKRRLHRALGNVIEEGGSFELLVHQDGAYRLRPGVEIYYDGFEWTQALLAARDRSNPKPEESYRRVVELYRGPFLKGHDDLWIEQRRASMEAGFVEAIRFLAEEASVTFAEDPRQNFRASDEALRLYSLGLAESPQSSEIVKDAVSMLLGLGRRMEALAFIESYYAGLKLLKERVKRAGRTLKVTPDPTIKALETQIRKGQ